MIHWSIMKSQLRIVMSQWSILVSQCSFRSRKWGRKVEKEVEKKTSSTELNANRLLRTSVGFSDVEDITSKKTSLGLGSRSHRRG